MSASDDAREAIAAAYVSVDLDGNMGTQSGYGTTPSTTLAFWAADATLPDGRTIADALDAAEADRAGRVQAEAELAVALRVLRDLLGLNGGSHRQRGNVPVAICSACTEPWPCPAERARSYLKSLASDPREAE